MQSDISYQGFSNKCSSAIKRVLTLSMNSPEPEKTDSSKLVIILVGLPARGKSYISRKICTFLTWRGHNCRVFNVGQYRRDEMKDEPHQNSDFFSSQKIENISKRNSLAFGLLEYALNWLKNCGGQIAIFDATNTTKSRRKMLIDMIKERKFRYLFIESICDKKDVIEANLKAKAERSPDFAGMDFNNALFELKKRLSNYEKVYETIEDDENFGYIKLIDLGTKMISYKLSGFISRLLMVFLLNLKIEKNVIWLTRAGNSTSDVDDNRSLSRFKDKDSGLSAEGLLFAKKLAEFIKARTTERLLIWTSPLKRAVETAQYIKVNKVRTEESFQTHPDADKGEVSILTTPLLNMIDQGICYGMKPSVIKNEYGEYYKLWMHNPLTYRFPGGESYMDAVERVEPIVIDLEQISSPVLIVTHVSILRILYAYFKSIPIENIVDVTFPQGLIVEFKPSLYGWIEERHDLMAHERKTLVEDLLNKDIQNIPIESEIFAD